MSNPYTAVPPPSYAGPMVNWFGGQGQGAQKMQPQQAGVAPGSAPPAGGSTPPVGAPGQQPTMAQQQMQGLGGYLQKLFGNGNQPGGAAGMSGSPGPANACPPGTGWAGGWNVNG